MSSQWQYFLKNLGEWQGSFTRFSPQGELVEDTPTLVSFEGRNDNTSVHQVVRRFFADREPQDLVLDYSSLNRSILFFENGAFSQGAMQWGPFSEFGAELGLIAGDRRLRLVQLFDKESKIDRLTLIREKLAGTDTPERPPLKMEQLWGEWQGEAVTLYPDLRPSQTYATHLQIDRLDRDRLSQTLSFGTQKITSIARIEGSMLDFQGDRSSGRILLLPDGASCYFPLQIQPRQAFFLELGWLTAPTQRQRMIRTYGNRGEWESLTLVKEEKIG